MPAPPYSLHQPELHGERPANVVCGCCFAARPANCWLLFLRGLGRSDYPPAVFACSGLVLQAVFACLLAFAMPGPLPFSSFAPFNFALPPPVHFHVRRDHRKASVCKLQELSRWQLQHGPAVAARAPVLTFPLFPAESIDPGPWFSVEFVRLSCTVHICVRPRHVYV